LWGSREVFGGSRSWSFRVLGLQLSRADSRLRTLDRMTGGKYR
jgi:hypothetical protein